MTCLDDFRRITVGDATVFHGSNLDVLPLMADNSVDSIVCDPPYELGFMGKKWDSTGIAYSVELWRECFRVLKPGGHLLAFGGSRTWHRLAVAIEDAGFEVRDSIAWLYGSGFPESLNVSKAVDDLRAKQGGEGLLPDEQKFCDWMRDNSGFSEARCKELLGSARFVTGVVEIVNTATKENPRMGRRAMVPTFAAWEKIKPLLATSPPDWVEALVKEPPKPSIEHPSDWNAGKGEGTFGSNEWAGWGTALKPAFEPVVVARKPLIGTVAENVLTWGVGGLNIDGSRIGTGDDRVSGGLSGGATDSNLYQHGTSGRVERATGGRWPANIILDEYTAGLLDEQTEDKITQGHWAQTKVTGYGEFGGGKSEYLGAGRKADDVGGASRFFYVAKASKRDRNEGLDGLEAQRHADREKDDGIGGDNPRNRSNTPKQNFHPTVKPTDLMRYLIKLVTPVGGLVLDPFTGSGSTGKAALLDGFRFIGIELTEEYLPIIEGRLLWAMQQQEKAKAEAEAKENETLF